MEDQPSRLGNHGRYSAYLSVFMTESSERNSKSSASGFLLIGSLGCFALFLSAIVFASVSFTYFPTDNQIAFRAAKAGDIDRLKSVIANVDIGYTKMGFNSLDRVTLLSFAVVESSPQIVSLILEEGWDPNYQSPYEEWTPLHRVIQFREQPDTPQIVELLIANGANPDIIDQLGNKAIDYANRNDSDTLKAILRSSSRIAE